MARSATRNKRGAETLLPLRIYRSPEDPTAALRAAKALLLLVVWCEVLQERHHALVLNTFAACVVIAHEVSSIGGFAGLPRALSAISATGGSQTSSTGLVINSDSEIAGINW